MARREVWTPDRPSLGNSPGTLAALGVVVAAAWILVVRDLGAMHPSLPGFLVAWVPMMAAMMLPSVAPLLLLYRRAAPPRDVTQLAVGYGVVWTLAGVVAYGLDAAAGTIPSAVVLAAAGAYQLTPIKRACLHRCRTPADFLVQHWQRASLALGIRHGAWCLGCCWALMVVLVAVGSMGLGWLVVITALVAGEKLTRVGPRLATASGVGLVALALLEVVR